MSIVGRKKKILEKILKLKNYFWVPLWAFLSDLIQLTLIRDVYSKAYNWDILRLWNCHLRWPSQKFESADITGWINFIGDWCQEETCYLCCERCICSWSSLPSLNKRSHSPVWCHLFLLTLLRNCWFISLSSDFSVCLDWWTKWVVPYMHSQEREDSRLTRREQAPSLGPLLLPGQWVSSHRLHQSLQSRRKGWKTGLYLW